MSILNQLSSQVGDRSEQANRTVVARCLAEPALLAEIAAGLQSKDAALAGDCAEVMAQVAEQRPDWVAPYAGLLSGLLDHKKTRVRWEAMHALAYAAGHDPGIIAPLLPRLGELVRGDASVIVRDYAVEALGRYAASSQTAAEQAYPLLREALQAWGGKQAGRALKGLANAAAAAPGLRNELLPVAEQYAQHPKGVVRKAAKDLLKATE